MSQPLHIPRDLMRLFEALTASPDPVFVTDRHNRVVFWNRGTERVLGFTSEEVVGESCAEMLQGCDDYGNRYCSESCPVTQLAARGEMVRQFGLRFRAHEDRIVTMDVSILQFRMDPPDGFFLAHILRPSGRPESPVRQAHDELGPPRPSLIAVRESLDVRARKLTVREVEVLGMLTAGQPTPEIAQRLNISTLTARHHIQNILDKLEVHSKAEAVAFAFQKRLL